MLLQPSPRSYGGSRISVVLDENGHDEVVKVVHWAPYSADVRFFLTADPAARAHRRAVQRQVMCYRKYDAKVDAKSEEKILENISRLARLDSELCAAASRCRRCPPH